MSGTHRQEIEACLREGPCTAKDLSKRVGISERDVPDHLTHLEKSLKARGERLVVTPPRCLTCDFTFTKRHRFTRPGRCPSCGARRITLPRFEVG